MSNEDNNSKGLDRLLLEVEEARLKRVKQQKDNESFVTSKDSRAALQLQCRIEKLNKPRKYDKTHWVKRVIKEQRDSSVVIENVTSGKLDKYLK